MKTFRRLPRLLLVSVLALLLGAPLVSAQATVATTSGVMYIISMIGSLPVATNGIAVTSTDGLTLSNNTAATSGVTVQMSPRLRWRGNAWDTAASQTVDFFAENLPATAATPTGTWRLGYSLNGGATTYPVTVTSAGVLTTLSSVSAGANILAAAGSVVGHSGRNRLTSTASGLTNVVDSTSAFGAQFNSGTAAPTVTSCGTGTITAGSRNVAGRATATGATSCIVTFGSPAWTNTPFCTVTLNNAVTTVPYVSATTTTALTVAGLTAGDAFLYTCIGGI